MRARTILGVLITVILAVAIVLAVFGLEPGPLSRQTVVTEKISSAKNSKRAKAAARARARARHRGPRNTAGGAGAGSDATAGAKQPSETETAYRTLLPSDALRKRYPACSYFLDARSVGTQIGSRVSPRASAGAASFATVTSNGARVDSWNCAFADAGAKHVVAVGAHLVSPPAKAAEQFASLTRTDTYAPDAQAYTVTGIGDQATKIVADFGLGQTRAYLIAREGPAIVLVATDASVPGPSRVALVRRALRAAARISR